MEKKLNDMRRQAGKDEFVKSLTTYDGMCNTSVDDTLNYDEYDLDYNMSQTICQDDNTISNPRGKPSITSRLYRSFRDRYSIKSKLNKSIHEISELCANDTSVFNSENSSLIKSLIEKGTILDRTDSEPKPSRASWDYYRYEKMCHELGKKAAAFESQV